MAMFRRSGSFRRRFASSRSRFRRGLRTREVKPPQRWEVANIYVDETTQLNDSSGFETSIYTHLASISIALQNATGASSEQRLGQVISSMQRSIEIGGIVVDWDVTLDNVVDASSTQLNDGLVDVAVHLLSDRLDVAGAGLQVTPASLGAYSPFTTTFPMAVLTTANPDTAQKDVYNPTRIHWSKHWLQWCSTIPLLDEPEGLVTVWGQRVNLAPPTLNRRLRIRLDDEQGLFWGWFFRVSPGVIVNDLALLFRRRLCGRLYYRFVQ